MKPIAICHHDEFKKIMDRTSSFRRGDATDQAIDELMNRTLEEIVGKVKELVLDESLHNQQIYLWLPDFSKKKGIMLRLFWRNNFHWELAVKELTKEEMQAMEIHWADGYVYHHGCGCDERRGGGH